MYSSDEEFLVTSEQWGHGGASCHKCGWKGSKKHVVHQYKNEITLDDGTRFSDGNSKYAGALCPQCLEQLIFQCLECYWHGTMPLDSADGFPACAECGSIKVSCEVQGLMWKAFQHPQEFQVTLDKWCADVAFCHECGWEGFQKDLDHKFESEITLPDGTRLDEGNSKYAGATCPQCQKQMVFQCLECYWHGHYPVESTEGFPVCPECGTSHVGCEVREPMLTIIQQSVMKEAQLTLGLTH